MTAANVEPKKLPAFIAAREHALEARCAALHDALANFGVHDRTCVLSLFEAGEPTPDGGYRTKYAGQWYKRGEEPKCECGLDAALADTAAAARAHDAQVRDAALAGRSFTDDEVQRLVQQGVLDGFTAWPGSEGAIKRAEKIIADYRALRSDAAKGEGA